MKRYNIASIFFIVLIFITACGNDNTRMGMASHEIHSYAEEVADVADQIAIERKLIRRGEVRFETTNVMETKQHIIDLVTQSNGYISSDNVYDYSDRIQYHLSIRVPADQFDLLLSKIEGNAGDLESKNIYVQDVTEEFIDVQARIDIKKQLEARYKELLKDAKQVGDILNLEKEMGNLRSEIESHERRMKYLKDNVAMSSLEVSFYQKSSFGNSFFSKVGDAIYKGWDSFLWFLVALAGLWPFVIISVGVVITLRRYRRRKKNKVMR